MMFSPYTIILFLFTIAGAVVAIWAWLNMKKGKQQVWPPIEARIQRISGKQDLNPELSFSYTANQAHYEQTLGLDVNRYKADDLQAGDTITVYYDPQNPQNVRLQSKAPSDTWLILAAGIGACLLGMAMLLL